MSKEAFEFLVLIGSVAGSIAAIAAVIAAYQYFYARMMMERGFYWRIGRVEEDAWMPIRGRKGKP